MPTPNPGNVASNTRIQAQRMLRWSDAFENQVSQRTNVLDVAAHYPYSPERWTLRVDGTRQLLQYGDVAQYNHTGSRHELSPAGGETVVLETAEAPRYVVAYELAATFAFALNQELQSGDRLRIGLFNGSDGWFVEQNGTHAVDECDIVMLRQGSEVYRETDQDLRLPSTTFGRLKLQTGWYDITRNLWERSYPEDGEQVNKEIGTGSAKDSEGPITGNLPLRYEIRADANTTGLTLDAGSCAQVNLGKTTQFNRSKKFFATDSITVTGSWEPLRAIRIDPGRDNVNVQLSEVTVGKYSANDDVELLMMAGDPSNVLDGAGNELVDADFAYPNGMSEQNNVVEKTTAVEQFPDNTGTPQTSMAVPGGWQLARSELLSASGRSLAGDAAVPVDAKRPLYSRDIGVVLGKSATTGDVSYQIQTEQDW